MTQISELPEKFADFIPDRLLVANKTPEKLSDVRETVTVCHSNAELASCADIIFLYVRPVDLRTILEEIRACLKDISLIVSLNGSVTFDQRSIDFR